MSSSSPGVPGQRTIFTATAKTCLASDVGVTTVRGVIDSTYAIDGKQTRTDEIVPGALMALITSTGKWCPLKRTRVASGTSGSGSGQSDVNLKVSESRFFKADDTITVTVAAGTVNRTISSINYTTDVLTLDSAVDNPVIGGAVYARGTLAGAETCIAIYDGFVKMRDEDGTLRDKQIANLVVGGMINADAVLGDLTAARADASAKLGNIIWSDQHGE